mgnify:CR=1 FL=1
MFRKRKKYDDIDIQPHNPVLLKTNTEQKVEKIYEAYHYSKTLTLGELYYISYKDPEFYDHIVKVLFNLGEFEQEKNVYQYITDLEDDIEKIERTLTQDTDENAVITIQNVKESLTNVKNMLSSMKENEIHELVNNLYKASELRKQCEDEIEGWKIFLNQTVVFYGELPELKPKKEFYV